MMENFYMPETILECKAFKEMKWLLLQVSTATVECSFSDMKLIKDHLHSRRFQHHYLN